ncbi:redoxin domain-containing protein [Brachybacterium huguangmaarense]
MLTAHDGASVDLADLAGVRHAIVLLPGAYTPVCTRELPAIEALWHRAGRSGTGVPVLAVACDAPSVLAAWRDAEGVELPLLSDFWPHGALARQLDAFDATTGRCRRTSIVIDESGAATWRDDAEAGRERDMDELARALLDL